MKLTSVLMVLAVACGQLACGPAVVQLSRDEYERLPRDSRQEIFDAENDLVIALNRADDAADKRTAAEAEREGLDARWKRTESRLSSTGQVGRIAQARKVYEAKVAYLETLADVARAAIETTRAGVDLGRARLVLVRQRQAARIGRATLGSLKPLEGRVSDAEAKVKSAKAAEEARRTRAEAQLETWKGAEDAYARGSGDYDTGVWE